MDKLFGMYFVEALAEAKRKVKREENRMRRRKMSPETNATKTVVCSVCRTYGGTLMKREMEHAREDLLYAIEHDYKNDFENRIAAYRDAYRDYVDFEEWREEQED